MKIETTTAALPPRTFDNRLPRQKSTIRIAMDAMELGKCLEVRFTAEDLAKKPLARWYASATQAYMAIAKESGKKFAIRKQPQGFNIYRTA